MLDEQWLEFIDAVFDSMPKKKTPNMFWTNDGEYIFGDNAGYIDALANLLDKVAGGSVTATGYYDPAEDERDGTVDECTGCYYVHIC